MKKLFSIILILALASPMIWAQHKCGKNVKVKPGVEVLRDGGNAAVTRASNGRNL